MAVTSRLNRVVATLEAGQRAFAAPLYAVQQRLVRAQADIAQIEKESALVQG